MGTIWYDEEPPPIDYEKLTLYLMGTGMFIRRVLPDGSIERIDPRDFYAKPEEEPAPTSTPATTS